jgi:hypothetical protein
VLEHARQIQRLKVEINYRENLKRQFGIELSTESYEFERKELKRLVRTRYLTSEVVRDYIEREFGVAYEVNHIWWLLTKQLGWQYRRRIGWRPK